MTKPAPLLAIDQEQPGIALDALIGNQLELVGREGYDRESEAEPHECGFLEQEFGYGARLSSVWCAHTIWFALQGPSDAQRQVLPPRWP